MPTISSRSEPSRELRVAEPMLDREALIEDILDRLRRDARLDRERLGLSLEDLI